MMPKQIRDMLRGPPHPEERRVLAYIDQIEKVGREALLGVSGFPVMNEAAESRKEREAAREPNPTDAVARLGYGDKPPWPGYHR